MITVCLFSLVNRNLVSKWGYAVTQNILSVSRGNMLFETKAFKLQVRSLF